LLRIQKTDVTINIINTQGTSLLHLSLQFSQFMLEIQDVDYV